MALQGDERSRFDRYFADVYGQPLSALAEQIVAYRIDPSWMIGFAMTPAEQAEFEGTLPGRAQRLPAALARLG